MEISEKGLSLIKYFEGFRANAYNATGFEPYLTIGYGHYGPDVQPGQVVTEAQASQMLVNDLASYVQAVRNYTNGKANQNQFDALCVFCYNLGVAIFAGWGPFDPAYVNRNLPLYNKGYGANGTLVVLEGLNRRRKAELDLFNDGNVTNPKPTDKEKPLEGKKKVNIFVQLVDGNKATYQVIDGYYTHVLTPGLLENLKKAMPGVPTIPMYTDELTKMYKPLK